MFKFDDLVASYIASSFVILTGLMYMVNLLCFMIQLKPQELECLARCINILAMQNSMQPIIEVAIYGTCTTISYLQIEHTTVTFITGIQWFSCSN